MRSDRPATPVSPSADPAVAPVGSSARAGAGSDPTVFPFAAVVATDEAKLALLLAVIDPKLGGVLLRGDKGSAKTTLVRSLSDLLPTGGAITELPLGATEERVAGSLDLAAALGGDGVHFSPGVLAAAHDGILYVDEVNLLADHLVDLLLDAAASGRNRVERDGVSHSHDARFVLVGSMNPEEGDLRPQLLDRFGLAVDVRSPLDPAMRAEVVRRRLAFDADPAGFTARRAGATAALGARLAAARPADLSDDLLVASSVVCAAAGAEGLRADLTLARAAAAHAGWQSRSTVTTDDVRAVAHLVLAHRGRWDPLDGSTGGADDLENVLDAGLGALERRAEAESGSEAGEAGPDEGRDGEQLGAGSNNTNGDAEHSIDGRDGLDGTADPSSHRGGDAEAPSLASSVARSGPSTGMDRTDPGAVGEHDVPVGAGDVHDSAGPGSGDEAGGVTPTRLPASTPGRKTDPVAASAEAGRPGGEAVIGAVASATSRPGPGRRPTGTAPRPRGRTIGHRPVPDGTSNAMIAVVPTAQAAAARQSADLAALSGITAADLREPVRRHRTGHLVVLAVDASGSMGVAAERLAAVKGALLALLVDAYQRRDRVALVTFRNDRAQVVLEPTASVELARRRLESLATGGTTPLAAGLRSAVALAHRHAADDLDPVVIVVTDGRATVGGQEVDPTTAVEEALQLAASVAGQVPFVVVDVEDPSGPRLGLARRLADTLGAAHVPLGSVTALRLEALLRGIGSKERS